MAKWHFLLLLFFCLSNFYFGCTAPFGSLKLKMTFLLMSLSLSQGTRVPFSFWILNQMLAPAPGPSASGHLLAVCFLLLLMMSIQMGTLCRYCQKEKKRQNKWCCAPWKIVEVNSRWPWLLSLSFRCRKTECREMAPSIWFVCFFVTPLISINKACFSCRSSTKKMHMLNQMGEINSFIKLTLKSPVSQYHQRHCSFDFRQQLELKL